MKPPRVQVFPDSRGFFTGRKKNRPPGGISHMSIKLKEAGPCSDPKKEASPDCIIHSHNQGLLL